MRMLRDLEGVLVRAEAALAVVLVLTMLTLAGYNVVYRNVLVRLQVYWAHSGPPVEPSTGVDGVVPPESSPTADSPATKDDAKAPAPAGGDDFGGFGGGFGEDEPEEAASPKPAGGDDFGGFGGGFGEDEPEPAPAKKPELAAGDDFGGFGGGFGKDEEEAAPADGGAEGFGGFGGGLAKPSEDEEEDEEDDDLGEDDFGEDDPFANLAEIDAVATDTGDDGPVGGPPPAGSFAAWAIAFIDKIKLAWIDVLLRQLVIIVAFLGATLAAHRGKHINIDALSKIMPPGVRRVIPVVLNLVTVSVCLLLAKAGWDLVKISLEFPKELVPWAQESTFQLMFPIGFGLLAFHFSVRLAESIVDPPQESAEVEANEAEYQDDDATELNIVAAAEAAAADADPVDEDEASEDDAKEGGPR